MQLTKCPHITSFVRTFSNFVLPLYKLEPAATFLYSVCTADLADSTLTTIHDRGLIHSSINVSVIHHEHYEQHVLAVGNHSAQLLP